MNTERTLSHLRAAACGVLLLTQGYTVLGNNISVSNTTLSGQNTDDQLIHINFDVAWENSWRTSNNESNYDGAWLFVKWRKANTYDWWHCTLHQSQFEAGTGATLVVPSDEKGAFIHRAADGIGNVNFTGNKLTWRYGADGVLSSDSVEIKVFALEMVYIPEGPYYLGSGGNEINCFMDGTSGNPYWVSGPGPIEIGTSAGQLNLNGSIHSGGPTIPATFPNGYNAFWIMKYECTHQQFADFLNLLTSAQAEETHNTSNNFGSSSHPNFTSSTPDRAYHNLGHVQLTAFADWAGLRPYSELEFEKACRGANIQPLPNGTVWGTTSFVRLESSQITNAGEPNESVLDGIPANAAIRNGNAGDGPGRPVRVGIFARPGGSSRELSGATYYGVMNMGDNVVEMVIYPGRTVGQSVDSAIHGDGNLTLEGTTDIDTWQPQSVFGKRGNHWNSSGANGVGSLAISHRQLVANTNSGVYPEHGIRLARTAP